MINCAHPIYFEAVLEAGEPWLERIRGLRAHASTKSHAELNNSVLGGGCCTDQRHVEEICKACIVA
jgi:hypothetical protein